MNRWYESGFLPPDLLIRLDTETQFRRLKDVITPIENADLPFEANRVSVFQPSPSVNLNDHRYMRCPYGHIHRIKSQYLLTVLANEKPGKLWPKKILDDAITDLPPNLLANLWPCVVADCPIPKFTNKAVDDTIKPVDRFESMMNKIISLENQISSLKVSSSMKDETSKPTKQVSPPANLNKNRPPELITDNPRVNVPGTVCETIEMTNLNSRLNFQSSYGLSGQVVHVNGQILPNSTPVLTFTIPFMKPKMAREFFRNQQKTQFPVIQVGLLNYNVTAIIDFNLDESAFNIQCSAVTPNRFAKYAELSLTDKLQANKWVQSSNTFRFQFNQTPLEIDFKFKDAFHVPPYFMPFWCRFPLLFLGNDFLEKYDVYWSGDYRNVFLEHQSGMILKMNSSIFTIVKNSGDSQ